MRIEKTIPLSFAISLCIFYTYSTASPSTITQGVCYKHIKLEKPTQSIHMLTVNPKQATIRLGIANSTCASSATTSNIAQDHGAIAAINGGFFEMHQGQFLNMISVILDRFGYQNYHAYPAHGLKIKGQLYSLSPEFTGFIGWSNNTQKPIFGTAKSYLKLSIGKHDFQVDGFNTPYKDKPTMYSSHYKKDGPKFKDPVALTVIKDNTVIKHFDSFRGQKKVKCNELFYVSPQQKTRMKTIKTGNPVNTTCHYSYEYGEIPKKNVPKYKLSSMDYVLASTPLLIKSNKIPKHLRTHTTTFYTNRHPRSAVGIRGDGTWTFVVVDGRSEDSNGFTILELAHFMKKLGCYNALNLDGGGSSTMVIKNKVVNKPSGRQYCLIRKERSISNAFLILSKKSIKKTL